MYDKYIPKENYINQSIAGEVEWMYMYIYVIKGVCVPQPIIFPSNIDRKSKARTRIGTRTSWLAHPQNQKPKTVTIHLPSNILYVFSCPSRLPFQCFASAVCKWRAKVAKIGSSRFPMFPVCRSRFPSEPFLMLPMPLSMPLPCPRFPSDP